MNIQVRSGDGEVTATVSQRRMMLGQLNLLVEFSPTNRQWMPADNSNLLLTNEQIKQIKYLRWYAGRKGL